MSQTVPATAVLGPGKTGLTIGVTVLNLDGTTYAAFSATGVAETSVAGTYRKAGGVMCPDAGAYLVWGVSGTAYAEATVAGAQMDLVDAPNATAVAAIQTGLATPTNITAGTITTVTNLTNLPAAAALEATLTAMKGATFSGATDSLEAIRDRGDAAWIAADVSDLPTNSELATALASADDAMLTAIADVPTVAEFEARTLVAASYATAANLATLSGYVDTEVAAILADTNELQTDWANGGRLDLILDARASQTSVDDLPTNSELATALSGITASVDQQDIADALLLAPSGAAASGSAMDGLANILEDTGTTIPAAIAGIGGLAGSGAISFPVTINDEDSNPIDGVEVWVSTDSAGTNVVAGTLSTDALGLATFMLDAGAYYVWRQASGYNFTNPVAITVS
jgi:hypothetical protein